jgi:hypothetical protein
VVWLQRHVRSPAAAHVTGGGLDDGADVGEVGGGAQRSLCRARFGPARSRLLFGWSGTFRNAVVLGAGGTVVGLFRLNRDDRTLTLPSASHGSTRRRTGGAHDDATAAELARVETPASDAMRGGHMVSFPAYVAR